MKRKTTKQKPSFVPLSFSCPSEFAPQINARAREVGMSRSRYLVRLLKQDLRELGLAGNGKSQRW